MSSHDASRYDFHTADASLFLLAFLGQDRPLLTFALRLWRWLSIWRSGRARDETRTLDAILLTTILLWSVRHDVWQYLGQASIFRFVVTTSITAVLLYLGMLFYTWHTRALQTTWATAILKQDALSSPWIVPSKTTHTRLFPKQHSFSYSYLTVAIPVGFKGWCWPMLSVDTQYARCWFHVQASDHLGRGNPDMAFKEKLAVYLRREGVQDTEWTYAYLVTAPRFLGYSFNPVSFWYIYDEKRTLKKMILEVNNTFDERRMYLLDAQNLGGNSSDDKFKQTWAKDFHVSPFNSRKGSYSLTASDPFSHDGGTIRPIDNTIVMSSSKGHGKIVARLLSVGDAINPRQLSRGQMITFLARWWWVGFFTFPRILYEATRLFFKRKLHVWFRPEVLNTSVGRNPSRIETLLQHFLDNYITAVVRASSIRAEVLYARPDGTFSNLRSSKHAGLDGGAKWESLELRILTPAFYSRFPHYSSTREAFDREALFTDVKNRTVWVSDQALLAQIFAEADNCIGEPQLSFSKRLRWSLHKWLRCPPPAQAYSDSTTTAEYKITDVRPSKLSPLDRFVLHKRDDDTVYLRCCSTLFLAERCAFGLVPLLDLVDFAIRILICAFFTVPALVLPSKRPRSAGFISREALAIIFDIFGLSLLHVWSALKGLPG